MGRHDSLCALPLINRHGRAAEITRRSQGHWMTFLDLAEGGGEEMGKECSGGAESDKGPSVNRAPCACAVSRRADFIAGEPSFMRPAARSVLSRLSPSVVTRRFGGSSAGGCRLAAAPVESFGEDSTRLTPLPSASASSALVACVSEAATRSSSAGEVGPEDAGTGWEG